MTFVLAPAFDETSEFLCDLTLCEARLQLDARYGWIVLALFLLGATIEILQGSMSYGRQGDGADLLANSFGVFVGLLLALAWCGGWARRFEARLQQRFGS